MDRLRRLHVDGPYYAARVARLVRPQWWALGAIPIGLFLLWKGAGPTSDPVDMFWGFLAFALLCVSLSLAQIAVLRRVHTLLTWQPSLAVALPAFSVELLVALRQI